MHSARLITWSLVAVALLAWSLLHIRHSGKLNLVFCGKVAGYLVAIVLVSGSLFETVVACLHSHDRAIAFLLFGISVACFVQATVSVLLYLRLRGVNLRAFEIEVVAMWAQKRANARKVTRLYG
jgi:hypothetical protein